MYFHLFSLIVRVLFLRNYPPITCSFQFFKKYTFFLVDFALEVTFSCTFPLPFTFYYNLTDVIGVKLSFHMHSKNQCHLNSVERGKKDKNIPDYFV